MRLSGSAREPPSPRQSQHKHGHKGHAHKWRNTWTHEYDKENKRQMQKPKRDVNKAREKQGKRGTDIEQG